MHNASWKLLRKSGSLIAATVFAAVLLVGSSARAQTNSFTISVKGTITQRNGTKISVGTVKGQKNCSQLVSTCANVLVLTVDENNNFVEVDEVQTGATNMIVNTIWGSDRTATTAAGHFNSALVSKKNVSLPNSIPTFNGDLQADGKISTSGKTSFGGTLTGVWNDQSASGITPSAVFKGSIKSTGTIEVPGNF